jgi:hypothetical protein
MRASTCVTVSRLCVRPGCCWFAFPLVPALGSTGSAADRSALFASFAATTAGSDFPCSFIIGYRFSLPDADQKRDCPGRTRDLPSSDAILLRVICSSTPAGRAWPRLAALSMLRSTLCTVSAPATYPLRGSITHPTQPLCTLRGRRRRRLTQHSLPGCLLSITWVGLSPTDRASFAWRLRRVGPKGDKGGSASLLLLWGTDYGGFGQGLVRVFRGKHAPVGHARESGCIDGCPRPYDPHPDSSALAAGQVKRQVSPEGS